MRLTYRPQARDDLADIWSQIAEDSPDRADEYIDQLERRSLILAEFPKMGHPAEEVAPDVWVFPLDRYLIFYQNTHTGIVIARVWHASRDLHNIFFSDT